MKTTTQNLPAASANIEPFDFTQPSGLASEISERWSSWLDAWTADFNEKWSQLTGRQIEFQHSNQQAQTFDSVKRRLPKPAIGCEIAVSDRQLTTLLVMPRRLMLALVLQMLGDEIDPLPDDRPLTDVEWSLSEMIVIQLTASLGESWPQKESLQCRMVHSDGIPHRSRLLDPRTVVTVCSFSVNLGGSGEDMLWILPQEELEQLLIENDADHVESSEAFKQQMEHRALAIPVAISVLLGSAKVSVNRLAELKAGDVIVLDQRINEMLPLMVSNQIKFFGWLGRIGHRQAFKIGEIR